MIRINFGNIILKSCLDKTDGDINRSLFKVYQYLFNSVLKKSPLISLKEKINEERFYINYKLELGDLRIVYLESSIFIQFNS